MKTVLFSLIALFLFSLGKAQNFKSDVSIVTKDKRLNEILPDTPPNKTLEILGEGFEWTEGPLWLASENKLIFSDIPNNSIFEWSEKGGIKLYLKPAGYTGRIKREGEPGSNGLILSPNNELVLCQHGDRRIAKMESKLSNPQAKFKSLAEFFEGKRFNSPNDAVFHKNGDLYFTDPPYGLELNMKDPAKKLDFQGVFKVDKNGDVILLTKELSRPNGIAFSPDYKKLYVANSDPKKAIWMVYDVDDNGLLQNGELFFDATDNTKNLKGLPDGMKIHPDGWIFATGPGGVLIFAPDGEHLGTINTGEATSNCAFNSDYSELYLTADDYLLRVKLK